MKYILISMALMMTGCGVFTFSEGERSGKVVKISKKGFLIKTWEGCLALTESADSCFEFTVRDESLIESIKVASKSGERVTLHYDQMAFPGKWQGDSHYWIQKVEVSE